MSIEKCKDFVKDGYGTWDDTSKPTTYANMYDFMKNQNNIVMNLARGIWQPSTSYVVCTIIRSPSLPAGCVATCTTAGTSGTTEPKWTAYGTTVTDGSCKWKVNKEYVDAVNTTVTEMKDMKTITDGSAVFVVRDKRMQAMVDMFYPVGSVYISADKSKTKADFPFMEYGTWEEVPANLCLQTGVTSEAGTKRSAGLPNITGRRVASWGGGDYSPRGYVTGCFKQDPDKNYSTTVNGDNWNDGNGTGFSFDASRSNPIYGSSDTVQPPAYMVRAWVRTA